ncbi:MAG: ORC1-type DNA replication protein [Candidatus Aenigmatarchaeota archaeon]
MSQNIQELFNQFMDAKPIITNRNALSISFTPETIPHREKQIADVARILAPALKGERPSNIFIYGRTGTGKSLVASRVAAELEKASRDSKIKIIYANCKMKHSADTEYRLIAYLAKELGEELPFTGLPTDQVYSAFFNLLDRQKQVMILIIDEIDALVRKTGDEVLYNLTRINQELKNSRVCVVGITNDLNFIDNLDPRVRSSLSEEELVFPPYNAVQLQDILKQRADMAFREGAVGDGVLAKCAALAAQEHGDARRALDLLRVAAELAERNGSDQIRIDHVDAAEDKIDTDRTIETIKAQPKQSKVVLYSIIQLAEKNSNLDTGDVVDLYQTNCRRAGLKPLTQRRVSDLIAELDLFGIITTRVISKGRHGRTRTINLALSPPVIKKAKDCLEQVF